MLIPFILTLVLISVKRAKSGKSYKALFIISAVIVVLSIVGRPAKISFGGGPLETVDIAGWIGNA